MRKATIVAALLLLTPAASQAKTLEDLLVEKGVITKGEAAGASDSSASKVYWNEGTRVEFPDTGFTTSIATMIQTRYAFTDRDEDSGVENTSSFDVNRARLIVSGTAMNNEFSYMLSTDFVDSTDTEGGAIGVRDAYIDWKPCVDDAGVRMGAFKTAVSRQFNTDQQSMQFVDRSAVSEYFTLGRQNGLMAYGALADGMITGSAGIFNGESDVEDTRHTGIVAVRVNPTGSMDTTEEGDIDFTEELATSFGATYAYSDKETGGVINQSGLINIDANAKYMGLGVHAEYFHQNNDADISGDASGFYVQGGYYVTPKTMEVAARYGYTDCDSGTAGGTCAGNDNISEASATLNYYLWRHNLKAQLGYDFVRNDSIAGEDLTTNRYVFQLSSYF